LQDGSDEDLADVKLEIVERCRNDLELFADLFFAHYCKHNFNDFHMDVFDYYSQPRRKGRFVRGAPRGYAKSTITALIKPIHDACYGFERFILVCSNGQPQANGKLKDIRTEILTNNFLVDVYGIHFPRKNPSETDFTVICGDYKTSFKAVGTGVQVRGIRVNEDRPSKIICDDVEHSDEVENEEIRQKYENWFFEDICKVGDENTSIEFIGTILHPESLLKKILNNPSYDAESYKAIISWASNGVLWNEWQRIYTNLDNPNRANDAKIFYLQNEKAMLEGVKVLWPEKEPYYDLMIELIEQGRRSFMKEKQGEPLGSDSRVFNQFHWYKETEAGICIETSGKVIPWADLKQCAYGVIDPATGKKKSKSKGDFTCILTGYKDPVGRLLVHSDWTKRESPTVWMRQIFDYHDFYSYQKFGVETNLYKELLLPNLADERKRREERGGRIIKLGFYDIEQTANKVERITAIEPKVTHGWVVFNRNLSQEFKSQLENFPGEHDDCPDALEMLYNLVNGRYKASAVSVNAMGGR
jgi:predicted phage terminase large subunit-like protein